MSNQRNTICFPRRPVVGLSVAFTIGSFIGLSQQSPVVPAIFFVLAALSAVFCGIVGRRSRTASVAAVLITHVMVAAAACFLASLADAKMRRDYTPLIEMLVSGERITVAGTVMTEPYGQRLDRGGACVKFTLKVKSIPNDFGGEIFSPFLLQVECYGPPSILGDNPSRLMPRGGEGWCFTGRLREKKLPRGDKTVIVMSVSPDGWEQDPTFDPNPFVLRVWDIRRAAAMQLAAGIERNSETVSVMRAMLLGYRSDMPYELKLLFSNSGIMHILAISGLHVGLIAGFITVLMPILHVSKKHWGWLICPLIIIYTYLTGCRPSAQRACMMTVIMLMAPAFSRKSDSLASLCTTLIIMLFVSPFQLEDLGFLFSFVCVAAILTITPVIQSYLSNDCAKSLQPDEDPDFDIYERIREMSERDTVRNKVCKWSKEKWSGFVRLVRANIAVSIAAWAVSTPLTAMYFGKVSPIGILNNLFAVPLSLLIILSGCLSLISSLFSQWLSVTFNCASHGLVQTLIYLTNATSYVPGASFETQPWPVWAVSLWYVAISAVTFFFFLRIGNSSEEQEGLF